MRKIMSLLFSIIVILFVSSDCFGFEVPGGTWKGAAQVSFKGKITDSQTGKPIKRLSVDVLINGIPRKGAAFLGAGRSIDLGIQTIKTEDGYYRFNLDFTTCNGKTYITNFRRYKALGPPFETETIQIKAEGYKNKNISMPRDKIFVGRDNLMDIILDPISRGEI